MKLKDLLDLVRTDQQLNIYDEVNNVYLYRNIFKENCDNKFYSCEVVEIMTNTNDYGYSIIEIDINDMISDEDWWKSSD